EGGGVLAFPATPSASPYVAIGRVDNQTSSPQTAVRRWGSSSAPGPVEPPGLGQRECRDFSFHPRVSVSPPVSPVRADRSSLAADIHTYRWLASGWALRSRLLALSSASVALFQPYLALGRYQVSLSH